MVRQTMAKHPNWDYWLYEDAGNKHPKRDGLSWTDERDSRLISIYEGRSLSAADIRNEEYNLDEKRWCRKNWNASQAAEISFGRDPDKLKNADESLPISDDDDRAKHSELVDYIDQLEALITGAQANGLLPTPIFLPEQYIKWAKDVGVDYPFYVEEELKIVESELTYQVRPAAVGTPINPFNEGSRESNRHGWIATRRRLAALCGLADSPFRSYRFTHARGVSDSG